MVNEIILGIDPGINTTGYALLGIFDNECRLLDKGFISPPKNKDFSYRLLFLYEAMQDILQTHRPTTVVVEDIYSHVRFPYTAVLMGHARGVIFLAIEKTSAIIKTIPPSKVKKAISGKGNASKEQIRGILKQIYGLKDEFDKYPLDVSDALALATGYVFLFKRR